MLTNVVGWIEPHAVVLALVLPAVIRVVGHWLPEELFMIGMGVLASRRSAPEAAVLLGAVWIGHFVSDQGVYTLGRAVMARLLERDRVRRRVAPILRKIRSSSGTLWGFVPARVLPLGRGAWLLAVGGAGVPRGRFAAVDAVALTAHVVLWCGLGWVARDGAMALWHGGRLALPWAAVAAALALGAILAWRRSTFLSAVRLRLERGRG